MTSRALMATLLPLALLCACGSPRDTVPYPYASRIDTGRSCAELRGRYLLPVQAPPGGQDARAILGALYRAAGRSPETWKELLRETSSPRTLLLQIDTSSGEELGLALRDPETGALLDTWTLSARQGQYRCVRGGIAFPESSRKGSSSGEGVEVRRVDSGFELSLATDGALIGHWTSTTHGSAWLLPYSQHNEAWYRLQRQP